ncbi:MAG: PaaI family thioesterase [Halodesulfurarchaeum sp.]
MSDLSESAKEEFHSFVDTHGFLSHLGVTIDTIERDRVVMRIPYDESLTNPQIRGAASIHGGVASTLIDTSSAFALRTTFENPDEARLATIDLSVSYLRPAVGDLVADAKVIRAGGHVGVTQVIVESETPDGEVAPVAAGMTNYRLFR